MALRHARTHQRGHHLTGISATPAGAARVTMLQVSAAPGSRRWATPIAAKIPSAHTPPAGSEKPWLFRVHAPHPQGLLVQLRLFFV